VIDGQLILGPGVQPPPMGVRQPVPQPAPADRHGPGPDQPAPAAQHQQRPGPAPHVSTPPRQGNERVANVARVEPFGCGRGGFGLVTGGGAVGRGFGSMEPSSVFKGMR